LAGVALLASPAPAHAVKRSFFGIQGWLPPSADEFVTLGRQGVGTVRMTFGWAQHEPEEGTRTWGYADDMAARAAVGNVNVLPVLVGSPAFAAEHPTYPPMTREGRRGYVRFVGEAVERYGRQGAFWRENPHLPYKPIKSWQVWNEPNLPAWWHERPNAKQYVSLVRVAARAIRKADPKARVVLAGVPETDVGISAAKFLRQIYRVRGARRHFDVVALNPYASNHRGVVGAIERARRIMRRNGDGRARLMVTEIGWATGGTYRNERTRPFRTTLEGQAGRLRKTFRTLLKNRRRFRLDTVVWFSLQDRRPRDGEENWWGLHTGLRFADGRAKPAWSAFTTFVGRHT
jgi:hypothetical protein